MTTGTEKPSGSLPRRHCLQTSCCWPRCRKIIFPACPENTAPPVIHRPPSPSDRTPMPPPTFNVSFRRFSVIVILHRILKPLECPFRARTHGRSHGKFCGVVHAFRSRNKNRLSRRIRSCIVLYMYGKEGSIHRRKVPLPLKLSVSV